MPAVPGDLTLIMAKRVASAARLAVLSDRTDPTLTQAIVWLNEGLRVLVRRVLPKRLKTGIWTTGRLDKLLPLLVTEEVTDGAPVLGVAELSLPASLATGTGSVSFFSLVSLAVGSGSYYAAKERPAAELFDRISTSPFAVTADNPIYAFGSMTAGGAKKLLVMPSTCTKATYSYLKMPGEMVIDTGTIYPLSTETFPLDRDLISLVIDYAIGRMYSRPGSSEGESALGKIYEDYFEAKVQRLLGPTQQTIAGA